MDTRLNFIQWNLRGLRASREDLELLCSEFRPLALALQECQMKIRQPIKGYNFIQKEDAAILIHESCPYTGLKPHTDLDAAAAIISLPNRRSVTVVSIYLPPSVQISKRELERLLSQLPTPILLLGDFNAHSPIWGDAREDSRGKIIEKLTTEHDLILLNTGQQTFMHSTYKTNSAIDLSIASPSLALDLSWKVHDDFCGSDHKPIVITFQRNHVEEYNTKSFNFNKANWNLYQCLCSAKIDNSLLSSDDPMKSLCDSIMLAAKTAIPVHTKGRGRFPRVPWFSRECKTAINNRKRAQRAFFRNPTQANHIQYKKLKAFSRYTVKKAKRDSWRNYVSSLNSNANPKTVWKAVRKLKGRTSLPQIHLRKDDSLVTDPKGAANLLGETVAQSSSSQNYSSSFQKIKTQKEKHPLNFNSDNSEPYNRLFSLGELRASLKRSNNSAAGPDRINYQFLTHLPESCLTILLKIFNNIWTTGKVPPSWKRAFVVAIPKPNRDHSDPTNYRPIALTSCLCKTMERMVNNRLMWVLEKGKHLSRVQCGFRRNHSTNDHLVRLETFIREAFARKRQVLAVFFDLEKAYDTTWKHGILADLFDLDIRGRLPLFISDFLSERHFKIKLGTTLSSEFSQESGVPQGSILSPALFNIKINNIVKCLPSNVKTSLFVDDFAIYIEGKHIQHLERSMQLNINKVQKWVDDNGFKFSASKTTCVHFHSERKVLQEPNLLIGRTPIKVATQAKFLGVTFDQKCSFLPHVRDLKKKCQKALNILRVVGHTDWGADRSTLLKLYRTVIRSKLDYGSIVYGSAPKHILHLLDPIHHQGLRIALGAFRTSPVQSLYAEANEPSLHHRRIKLSINYYLKLKSLTQNPAHDCVFKVSPSEIFETTRKTPPFGVRVLPHVRKANINLEDIAKNDLLDPPPWQKYTTKFNFSLTKFSKNQTNPLVFQQEHLALKEQLSNSVHLFTDGSKEGERVSAAVFSPDYREFSTSARLKDNTSVCGAELHALLLALNAIKQIAHSKRKKSFTIWSDSLSALQTIYGDGGNDIKTTLIKYLLADLTSKEITFIWLPGHVGIYGNEQADRLAKEARSKVISPNALLIPGDLKGKTNEYIGRMWQEEWDLQVENKLHEVFPRLTEGPPMGTRNRREESVMSRLRIGHSWLSHGFLLRGEEQPFCHSCNCVFNIKHILTECSDLSDTRRRYYLETDMYRLFKQTDPGSIFQYLKEIRLYHQI